MEYPKSLAPHTGKVFEAISRLECIKLTNGSRFIKEKGFEELLPVYDVTPYDIQEYIKQKLLEIK